MKKLNLAINFRNKQNNADLTFLSLINFNNFFKRH